MIRKEQNKILDDKIESNINQYKVDRLNAEISAFSSGDLNKYEFLTRKDLKYKPNALDKVKLQFSPLGKTFSVGLDQTVQGYQEEGVIKLLKDIRDNLAGGNRRDGNDGNDGNDDNDDNDDNDGNDGNDDNGDNDDNDGNDGNDDNGDNDDNDGNDGHDGNGGNDDNDGNDGNYKTFDLLNKFKNNIEADMHDFNKKFISKENKWSAKLNKLNNNIKKLDNYIKKK